MPTDSKSAVQQGGQATYSCEDHAASRADCTALWSLESQQPDMINLERAAQVATNLAVPHESVHMQDKAAY